MMLCKNCNGVIRWTEIEGWVHGRNGDGYRILCNEELRTIATPKPEDIAWLTD